MGRQTAHVEHTNQCLCVAGTVDELHGSISSKSVGNESIGEKVLKTRLKFLLLGGFPD